MVNIQSQPPIGLIHHTDPVAMFNSMTYQAQLANTIIVQKMNGKKTAYDNGVAESFFNNLKNE